MNHYETLDVPRDASHEAIRAAYRKSASAAHPDKGGSDERMQAVNRAYEVLGDIERRKVYDETGADAPPTALDEQARSMLAAHFAKLLDADADVALLHTIRARIEHERGLANGHQAAADQAVMRLQHRRGTVSSKGANVFHALIDQKIAALKCEASSAATFTTVAARALELLDDYSEERPAPKPTTASFMWDPSWA